MTIQKRLVCEVATGKRLINPRQRGHVRADDFIDPSSEMVSASLDYSSNCLSEA